MMATPRPVLAGEQEAHADEFVGRAVPLSSRDWTEAAEALGCEAAVIRAVAEVEAPGVGFLGDRRPYTLFEAHVFARRTGGRYTAKHPSISSPTWNRALYRGAGSHIMLAARPPHGRWG